MSVFGVFLVFSISPYLVQMQENKDQENSEFRHFSRNVNLAIENEFK